jgi:glutamate dehydrogenase
MKSLKDIAQKSFLSEDQLNKIEVIMTRSRNFHFETIRAEIDWFCTGLEMPDYYFKTTPLETIAGHIEAIKAAEIIASTQQESGMKLDLARELQEEAIYLVNDYHFSALEVEKKIEDKYPNARLQSYRTQGKAVGLDHLRMYLVYSPKFCLKTLHPEETDLRKIACPDFLNTATPETLERYQAIINKSHGWQAPLIEMSLKEETGEHRIMVAVNRDSSAHLFSNISDVINSHKLVSNRKYVEQFANGKTVYAFYLDKIEDPKILRDLTEDISLVYVIPESPLASLFREGRLNAHVTIFGVSAWSFCHQFLTSYNEEYTKLAQEMQDLPELLGILRNLKTRLAKDTFDEARVWDSFVTHTDCLKKMFRLFDKKFNPFSKERLTDAELEEVAQELQTHISTDIDTHIFTAILTFIKVIKRTNFYKKDKTTIAFMYDPSFLNPVDYPEIPFGVFHIIGIEFRGFHVRFRDVARGGIRIVRSNTIQNYLNNSDFIFDENYNLAYTQQKKNKDIPEGGSKGTILLRWKHQDKDATAFKKYVDGLLDLILPDEGIVDDYGKEVILFLGPDEGTADLMEWASVRARERGYPYWQAFSTGKPLSMGGIPHDLYGMTTNSSHQYVIKILDKLNMKEESITKVMTGGPDGDLGSNEILISKDKILSIIDGSGVLYDPGGIDRMELIRLAKGRVPVENFRLEFLSSKGFLVKVKDQNTALPGGEKVISGLDFRNTFHLHPKFKADLFVPCGGRPASININNWKEYIDEKGRPRFRFIVEGANLFITQDARLRLEERGVIIYKDASANKGGVTSSSLEVFASLALLDDEYEALMSVKNGTVPEFRKAYVEEILRVIRENASQEFDIIWTEHQKRGLPRAALTDRISEKINVIKDAVINSRLDEDKDLFAKVLECYCPKILIKAIGREKIITRVPNSYLKAILASRIASRYIYSFGLGATEIDFHGFIKDYKKC